MDVENWPHEDGVKVECPGQSSVPGSYISIVRQVVRDILLEKLMMPTIYEAYSQLSAIKVSDVLLLNFFDDILPPPTSVKLFTLDVGKNYIIKIYASIWICFWS